jgi:hypothetical protein
MNKCLGMEYEEIGKTHAEWNKSGPLVSIHTLSFVDFAG